MIVFFSCNEKSKPRVYQVAKSTTTSNQIVQDKKSITKFTWNVPSDWIENEPKQFQIANYSIPISDIDNAIIAISKFGGNAGGIMANVNRWRKQIELPEISLEDISKKAKQGLSSIGEYSVYKIINSSKPEIGFLCMILPIADGTIFVKMTSDTEGIKLLENKFMSFCSSFKMNDE